jgi:hypothetical protein
LLESVSSRRIYQAIDYNYLFSFSGVADELPIRRYCALVAHPSMNLPSGAPLTFWKIEAFFLPERKTHPITNEIQITRGLACANATSSPSCDASHRFPLALHESFFGPRRVRFARQARVVSKRSSRLLCLSVKLNEKYAPSRHKFSGFSLPK